MLALDHLVVACRSLDSGRAWCESTLGAVAQAGGRHALMGTHNLLLSLASERFPNAYLELIAIDPDAPPPAQPRWFDLDDPALQRALDEPRLVHWVARSDDIEASAVGLRGAGHDPGPVVAAERMTSRGMLRWRITLPADGRRPLGGAMPLWIQWSGEHPAEALPASGVAIESLKVGAVPPALFAGLPPPVERGHPSTPLLAALVGARGRTVLSVPALPDRLSA